MPGNASGRCPDGAWPLQFGVDSHHEMARRTGKAEDAVVYSQAGYCSCGREIWIEYLFDGKRWTTRFQDDTLGEIKECPQCGKVIQEDDLESV